MSFGEQLQSVRRRSGLTQEQFAEELNVSRQAVSKWESGKGYPEMEKILYICNRYGVTLNELFAQEVPLGAEEQSALAPGTSGVPVPTLQRAASSFFSNLSPKNKWLALGAAAGTLLVSLLIGAFLKGGNSEMIPLIWVGVMVIFVGGLVVAMLNGAIWLQLVVFFAVSIGCMIAARPLVVKYINQTTVATNADRVLGATARVTEAIDNTVPVGAVYVDGKTWSARSETGENIAVDTLVRVTRMEGVRLFVKEKKD